MDNTNTASKVRGTLTIDVENITVEQLGKEGGQALYRMLMLRTLARIADSLESIDDTLQRFGDYGYDKEDKEYDIQRKANSR